MRIEQATDKDIARVAFAMRDRDVTEFAAVLPADERPELAGILVSRYAGRPDVLAACARDGSPVCIGCVVEVHPNVVSLGFFATDEWPRIALPLSRWIKRELFPRLREAGVHRIQALSMAGYDEAHRWLALLGLRREAEHPGFGKHGETFVTFSWVRDAGPAGA